MYKKSLSLLFALLLVFVQSGAWALEGDEYNFDYKVEAVQENKSADNSTPVNIQSMTVEASRALLRKIPALPSQSEQAKFEVPSSPLKPSRDRVVTVSAPASAKTGQRDKDGKSCVSTDGQLIVNCSHQGEIEKLTQLTLTFSKPMVGLADLARADEKPFVTMTPQPEGKWYWTSPEVLVFDPEGGAVPYATEYVVKLREGVKSDGLSEWKFRTPRLQIVRAEPEKHFAEEKIDFKRPVWRVVFNQPIDHARLMEHLELRLPGRSSPLELARVDEAVGKHSESFLVRSVAELDRSSNLQFVLAKGAPSIEGPLLSDKDQSIEIKGVLPLQISDVGLSPQGSRGEKFGDIVYKLNYATTNRPMRNELSAGMIRFEPPATKNLERYYDYGHKDPKRKKFDHSLSFALRPNTNYKVTFSKDIEDEYGQRLGKDVTFKLKSGPVEIGVISEFNKNSISLHDMSPKPVRFETYGAKRVRLSLHRATIDDGEFLFGRSNSSAAARSQKPMGELLHTQERSANVNGSIIDYDVKSIQSRGLGRYLLSCEVLDDNTGATKAVAYRLLQVTNLIMVVYGEHPSVFVGDTATGAPVVGAKVGLLGRDSLVTTNKMGIAYPPVTNVQKVMDFLEAKSGDDSCICRVFNFHSNVEMPIGGRDRLLAYSDRGLYRPGEPLRIKGWLRKPVVTNDGEVLLEAPGPCELSYQWLDPKFQLIKEGTVAVDRFGGFVVAEVLPRDAATGRHYMGFLQKKNGKVTLQEVDSCKFEVQEFRRPEFELKLNSSTSKKVVVGEKVRLTVSGASLSGGVLRGAKTTWAVSPGRGHLFSESYPGFSFNSTSESLKRPDGLTSSLKLKSDDFGDSAIEITPMLQGKCAQVEYHVKAIMQDVNRQERLASTIVCVLPADTLVGVSAHQALPALSGKAGKVACQVVCIDRTGELVKDASVDLTPSFLEIWIAE